MSQAIQRKQPSVMLATTLSRQAGQYIQERVSQTTEKTKNGNLTYKKAIKILQETLHFFPHDHSQGVINEVMRKYLLVMIERRNLSEKMPPKHQALSAEELLVECQRIAKSPNKATLQRTLLPIEVLITGKGNRLIFNGFSKQKKPPTLTRKIGR